MEKIIQASSAAKSIYGCGDVTTWSWLNYAYALLTISGADGEVSQGEMNWLVHDFMAIIDAPDEFVEDVKQFDYHQAQLSEILPRISFDIPINYRRALLYDAIKMSFADNEYSEKEREAVHKSAELLKVPVYMARTLEGLVNTEKSIDATRRSIFELDEFMKTEEELPEGTRHASRLMQYNFGLRYTSDEMERNYGYALMKIAGADGKVSEEERNWYRNVFARMAKTPAYVVHEVLGFDYQSISLKEILARLQKEMPAGSIAKTILYNSIKMSRADFDYPKSERDAVTEAARFLGVPTGIANTMNYLIDAEDKVEKMRKTLFEVKLNN